MVSDHVVDLGLVIDDKFRLADGQNYSSHAAQASP